jgi:septum formation protein
MNSPWAHEPDRPADRPADPPRTPSVGAGRLVLGSTSRYRRELLARLRLPFDCEAPDVDETPDPGEAPAALAVRLAAAKAHEVARRRPGDWVIGSDQVAELDGLPIGKPLSHERAVAQLRAASGRDMRFHTAVHLVGGPQRVDLARLVTVHVRFRVLSEADIERYLRLEEPYDCAGSAKSEGLGITLLERLQTDDPTALVGLPLIATTDLLREAGLDVLAAAR